MGGTPAVWRLTEYQRGSIFGALLVGVAFAAALSVVPRPNDHPPVFQTGQQLKSATSEHQKDETWWQWTQADPVATYTLGLCLIALVQAGLFVWQLGYMREGLADAAAGAQAAEEAAKAATDLNKITRDAYVADQRPWVSVDLKPEPGGRLIVEQDGNITADITISYRNHGRTPAINVLIGYISIIHDHNDIKRTQDKVLAETNAYMSTGANEITLFPNDTTHFDQAAHGKVAAGAFQLTPHAGASNPIELLLVGCLRYQSPGGQIGVTDFCFNIIVKTATGMIANVRQIGPNNANSIFEFHKYNVGNSAT